MDRKLEKVNKPLTRYGDVSRSNCTGSPIYLTYWLMILSLIFYEFKEIQVPIFVIPVLNVLAIKGSILLFE